MKKKIKPIKIDKKLIFLEDLNKKVSLPLKIRKPLLKAEEIKLLRKRK